MTTAEESIHPDGTLSEPDSTDSDPGPREVDRAYERALNFLSYRPRSINEVRRRLKEKGEPEGVIEQVILRLERAQLLDDDAFARYWVSSRQRFAPRGDRALRFELRQKAVDASAIENALAESLPEMERAATAGQRSLSRYGSLSDDEFRRKMFAYLGRLGFAPGDTWATINELVRKRGSSGGVPPPDAS